MKYTFMPERPAEQGWYLVIASWIGVYSDDIYYEYVVSYYEKGTFHYLPLDYKVVAWTKLNDPKEEFENAGIRA